MQLTEVPIDLLETKLSCRKKKMYYWVRVVDTDLRIYHSSMRQFIIIYFQFQRRLFRARR